MLRMWLILSAVNYTTASMAECEIIFERILKMLESQCAIYRTFVLFLNWYKRIRAMYCYVFLNHNDMDHAMSCMYKNMIIVVVYLAIKYRNKNMKVVNDGIGQQGRNCPYSCLNALESKSTHNATSNSATSNNWSWYIGRWWVGCYIWYSEEGSGRGRIPPRPLHVCISGPLLCGFNVPIKGLRERNINHLSNISSTIRNHNKTQANIRT